MSVMEMSHRSKAYEDIILGAEQVLREIMGIPSGYKVLFLQGGASSQFAMVPLNLFTKSKKADFVNTGTWAKKALAEAKRYGQVNVVASSEDTNFNRIPDLDPKTSILRRRTSISSPITPLKGPGLLPYPTRGTFR